MENSESIEQKKAQLRSTARQYLRSQSLQITHSWGQAMAFALFSHSLWQQSHRVFCFVSTPHEPDTMPILQAVLDSGRTLCVPRTSSMPGEMDAVVIHSFLQLSPARFDLLEPSPTLPAVLPESIDLVIAPCLMAQQNGARLGQGGGYYDRFLSRCTCPVIVLCPDELTRFQIPVFSHDKAVDFVLTESGFLK